MRKYLFSGFVVLLPIILTYVIIVFGIGLITGPFELIAQYIISRLHLFDQGIGIFSRDQVVHFVSKFFIIVDLLSIVFLIGFMANLVIFHSLGRFFDQIVRKIPFINRVYGTSKDLVDAIFLAKSENIRQAVLVPYPSIDERSIGISTGEYTANVYGTEEQFVSVFVPSIPNATAGYLVTYRKSQVSYLEISAEEALKKVMSFNVQ